MKKNLPNNEWNNGEAFWSNRYIEQRTGWDLGKASDPIRAYVDQLSKKDIKILLPGAGNAYEAEYLFQTGFTNVSVLDISKLPLNNFKRRVPDFPKDHLIHGDFFSLEDRFDLILEQTFFCSIPPVENNRKRYIKKMYELLNSQGKLVGVWFNFPFSGELTKRPFGCTEEEYIELFSPYFELNTFEEAYNSVAGRSGKELFGIWQKRDVPLKNTL